MLPFKLAKNTKSEHWLGLLDGTYAFAFTIVALELPGVIQAIDSILSSSMDRIDVILIMLFEISIFYVTFLVAYETWGFHKSIILLKPNTRTIDSHLTAFTLSFVTLIPAFLIFALRARSEVLLKGGNWSWADGHPIVGNMTLINISAIFFCLALMARSGRNMQNAKELRLIQTAATHRALVLSILFLIKIAIPLKLTVVFYLLIYTLWKVIFGTRIAQGIAQGIAEDPL